MVTEITEAEFDSAVVSSETPVIVDFWAPWCGPCRAVAPALDQIAAERAGQLKIVKVNVDDEPGLASRFGVASIPTIMLFRNGTPASTVIGAQPKAALERSLGL